MLVEWSCSIFACLFLCSMYIVSNTRTRLSTYIEVCMVGDWVGGTEELRKGPVLFVIENCVPPLWHTWAGRKPTFFVFWGRISEGRVENCLLLQVRKNSCSFFSPIISVGGCSWSLGSNFKKQPLCHLLDCSQGVHKVPEGLREAECCLGSSLKSSGPSRSAVTRQSGTVWVWAADVAIIWFNPYTP